MMGYPPPPDRVNRFADVSSYQFPQLRWSFSNYRQLVSKAVVDDIRRGGDKAQFAKAGFALLPGWSYRDMWWVSHNEHGAYSARGVHGQLVFIDPKAEMVIARYASSPLAANGNLDPASLPAYHALAKQLIANPR